MIQEIKPKSAWKDLLVPAATLEQLRDIVSFVRQRTGSLSEWVFQKKDSGEQAVWVLFDGEDGTAKRISAEVLAGEIGLPLYRVDLKVVVSQYIGETEKNLSRMFGRLRQKDRILFFDEADALFGKRTEVRDSHDRYANIEVNYLLQKFESTSGIGIISTNRISSMDPAFLRWFRWVVHFS